MDPKHNVDISTRDLIMMSWQESMELVRDFEINSKEIRDNHKAALMFARFAEDEGKHAAAFKELLHEYDDNK